MDRPRIYVDFNEMVEPDLVLLAKGDSRVDSSGHEVRLVDGLRVFIFMDDYDELGEVDNLIAEGVVEANASGGWTTAAKWCCRIDSSGIRHESDSLR